MVIPPFEKVLSFDHINQKKTIRTYSKQNRIQHDIEYPSSSQGTSNPSKTRHP